MSQAQSFDFKGAIEEMVNEFESAASEKSGSRIASLYTDDATLLPPGLSMIKGKANIQGFWQSFLDAGASDAKLRSVTIESSGDLAYEIGTFEGIVPDPHSPGKTVRASGKYLVVWKRQADGGIKMVADMFSPNS